MAEEVSIRVNFAHALPVFPLDQVALLPQQVLPLHIFEPRYRQMIDHALDGPGQIAMATFQGENWKIEYQGAPPLRPAVCVGQLVQHERLPDGRYNILLQGVCRARITGERPPDAQHLYRRVQLEPVGLEDQSELAADELRVWVAESLSEGPLARLAAAEEMLKLVENESFPVHVLIEVISFALVSEDQTRYALLAEGSLQRRVRLLRRHLMALADLLRKAAAQHPEEWPKGCSWN